MGVEALTHRDDGTVIAIPESHDDWQQWVSAGRTRNWTLGDPLIDWLRLYGKDRDYIPKQELDSYVEELDFLNFIFERGQEFETGIPRLLEERYEVATIARDYRDIANLGKAEETFAAMQRGVPVIYQGVLWDGHNLNYGSPDFLVRSDVVNGGGLRPTRHVARPAPRPPGAAPTAGWGKCPPRPLSGAGSPAPYLPVQPFLRVVGPQLLPVGHWEGRAGPEVRRGVRQQFGHLGKGLPELFHHPVQLAVDLGGRQLLARYSFSASSTSSPVTSCSISRSQGVVG